VIVSMIVMGSLQSSRRVPQSLSVRVQMTGAFARFSGAAVTLCAPPGYLQKRAALDPEFPLASGPVRRRSVKKAGFLP
jgi:hypothetical protein